MKRYQLRLLVMTLLAVVLIVTAAFVMDWFTVDLVGTEIHIDLHSARACASLSQCVDVPLSKLTGLYPSIAALGFWCSVPLVLVLLLQAGAKIFSGAAHERLTKLGYGLGAAVFLSAFSAGYLFGPEAKAVGGMSIVEVERTIAPMFLVLGSILAMVTLRYALLDESNDDVGAYKPIVIDKKDVRTRPATVPPPSLAPRAKAPTAPPPPLAPRAKAATDPPPPIAPRTRTASANPVDVAHRLGGAPLDVAIRPPLPEPEPVPPDQIPVAPGSGLTIRKRTPSAGPLAYSLEQGEIKSLPPEISLVIRSKSSSVVPMPSVAAAIASGAPPKLRGRVSYAVGAAAFSGAGLTANREDGFAKLVKWSDVVGIVARRLPPTAPYDGAPFIDVVSTAGATLRLLPWTDVTGHPLAGDPVEAMRTLVKLLAAQCLDAKLDAATNTFAGGNGKPAQLPDEKTLAAHDERLR